MNYSGVQNEVTRVEVYDEQRNLSENDSRAICPECQNVKEEIRVMYNPKYRKVNDEMPRMELKVLIARLDHKFEGDKSIHKLENGRWLDYTGHTIRYSQNGEAIFYALMLDSPRGHYFVQAITNQFEELIYDTRS